MIDGQPLACFQPFIDTATGRIAGVEALGRLRQSDGQLTSVGALFADPRTPATALRRLDRQIRDHALSRLHEAPAEWFLSLNMSPRWISRLRADQALPSLKQLARHEVDPQRIVFEITELGGNSERLAHVVGRYRDAGARIAIDDFGAGVNVSFAIFIASTGYEDADYITISYGDDILLDLGNGDDGGLAMEEAAGTWIFIEASDVSGSLEIAFGSNSGSEAVFIDAINIWTGAIPAPGALALLGLAGLASRRRR